MAITTSLGRIKEFNSNDPDFYRPRGHMFEYSTVKNGFDYNFGGNGTYYPNTLNPATSGAVQVLKTGRAITEESHGVYLAPSPNTVVYLQNIHIFFNHTSKNIFSNVYYDAVSNLPSGVQFIFNGIPLCETAQKPYGFILMAARPPMEITDAFGANQYLYSMTIESLCPGRLDGDNGDYLGVKTAGGNAVYVGSLGANKISHLHFTFSGWIVRKVEVSEGVWKEILYE